MATYTCPACGRDEWAPMHCAMLNGRHVCTAVECAGCGHEWAVSS